MRIRKWLDGYYSIPYKNAAVMMPDAMKENKK